MEKALNFASKQSLLKERNPEESDTWTSKNLPYSACLNQTPKTDVKRHFRRIKPAGVLRKTISDR